MSKQNSSKINVVKQEFLNSLGTKVLTNQQLDLCEIEIWENDLFDLMKSIKKLQNSCCWWISKRTLQDFLEWTEFSSNGKY